MKRNNCPLLESQEEKESGKPKKILFKETMAKNTPHWGKPGTSKFMKSVFKQFDHKNTFSKTHYNETV